jgi:hypothetical protein
LIYRDCKQQQQHSGVAFKKEAINKSPAEKRRES